MVERPAARLSTRPASYILGELLAAYNHPFHVRDVIAQAAAYGLAYLCEADQGNLTRRAWAASIRAMGGNQR